MAKPKSLILQIRTPRSGEITWPVQSHTRVNEAVNEAATRGQHIAQSLLSLFSRQAESVIMTP